MTITSDIVAERIALALMPECQNLNEKQKEVVAYDSGQLLVLAGPGSGKTESLTLCAMNLLLLNKALPSQIILCTYTKKAAYEMHDRIYAIASKVGLVNKVAQLRIDTIHGICQHLITENLYRLPPIGVQGRPLGDDFRTLDALSQRLFIFQFLDALCESAPRFFINLWGKKWTVAKKLQKYFDKITEEFIDPNALLSRGDYFLTHLAEAYRTYQTLLGARNCVDFAHLQRIVCDLLDQPDIAYQISRNIHYIFVDEYQDTNYIQEQLLLKLASNTKNICVVGDEDQSLYRFRGATVQNIRQFHLNFPDRKIVNLTINYRSHAKIIEMYNQWMASADWRSFRSPKKILARVGSTDKECQAVVSITGRDIEDEARQFAEFVDFLKSKDKITDYNQVALLMYSVRPEKSNPYISALHERNIPSYCSRARTLFDQHEVRLLIGCFARILNYDGIVESDIIDSDELEQFFHNCSELLTDECKSSKSLKEVLQEFERETASLAEIQKINKRLADYFYCLLATEPFISIVRGKDKVETLVAFSSLLDRFESYYRYDEINYDNLEELSNTFFNKFLGLVLSDPDTQASDSEQPFPPGHVPIITIHQAKGLEFPVVVVGSTDEQPQRLSEVDKTLRSFFRRPPSEPEVLIPIHDFMRLYYVAFSRSINLLVLTGNKRRGISPPFKNIMEDLRKWPDMKEDLLEIETCQSKPWSVPKPRYSYTSHIRMYETCPRQYQFYRKYRFVPSRLADTFLGLLVHHTIEKIHRVMLDDRKQIPIFTEERLRELFEQTSAFLAVAKRYSINESDKEKAFQQVEDYFYNNQFEMYDVRNVEEQIAIMQDEYILTGQVDVVMEHNGGREIWDLKTFSLPEMDSISLEYYEKQLYMYAYALEQRDEIAPERLVLYWTEKSCKEDAMMVFPYQRNKMDIVVDQFEKIVARIKSEDFIVKDPPYPHACKKCDMRSLCIREGVIEPC